MSENHWQLSRRALIGGGLALASLPTGGRDRTSRRFPRGFLWGGAISAHQSEGNNVNSDSWLLENLPGTVFREPSGDACDSWHRYAEDLDLARGIGLDCYRFSIEWARIEPEPGHFSIAALDHYRRVLEACHARGLRPILSYNHFTVPLWFARRGGWETADSADLFARYCARATEALGPLIFMASPFNEANIHLLARLLRQGLPPDYFERRRRMIAAAAAATASPAFSSLLFADADRIDANLLAAQRRATQAIKAGPGDFPVGVTLSTQYFEGVGEPNLAAETERRAYGDWWRAAEESDFVGVQVYMRLRYDAHGPVPPPPGAELTGAGYEYYPAALGHVIRRARQLTTKPIHVTETGIATDDDRRRVSTASSSRRSSGRRTTTITCSSSRPSSTRSLWCSRCRAAAPFGPTSGWPGPMSASG